MNRARIFVLAGLVLFSFGQVVRGQENEALRMAIAPLADGVPEVAVERLEKFLAQDPPAAERSRARLKLAEALTRAGRLPEARIALEKMFTYANHVGLYAEQIGLTGDQLGNFPQAFTHLSLISAAINLDRALR